MNKLILMALLGLSMFTAGCDKAKTGKNKHPGFMFWCHREEVVSDDFHVPDMKEAAQATYLQNRLKGMPGFVRSRCDLENHTLTISYQSSLVRKMNFENAISRFGFSVNDRPADPKTKQTSQVK